MDYLKLPKLNLSAIVITITLGVAAAVLVYFAQTRSLIPTLGSSPKLPSLETKTVVQEENTIISVIEKAKPSIVTIGSGIGFITDSRGLIITNKQIVSDPGPYIIVTWDGQKYESKKIFRDQNSDLGLIQIDAIGLPALDLADSSKLKLGQTVITVGQKRPARNASASVAGGQTANVSVGIISALGSLLQTDAKISTDSILLSSAGQIIGMEMQASGSAIPASSIRQFIDESVVPAKPYLGLRYKFVANGALVQEVIKNGPADIAGTNAGDIITKINGQIIDTENKVTDIVSKSNIGQQLDLTILRNEKEISVKAILQKMPNL